MVENRKVHSFSGNMYKEVLLQIVREAYSGCVPCVRYHYLRHPDSTILISLSDQFFYEGYVHMYCRHKTCCGCSCNVKIGLLSFSDHVKARLKISATRRHKRQCTRSRPVTGTFREDLRKKFATKSPKQVHRELLEEQTYAERCLGAQTYLPSNSVLRNIKNLSSRITKLWYLNLEILRHKLKSAGKQFIRSLNIYPPSVALYINSQLKTYNQLAHEDIVYFDATGSILRRHEDCPDYQVYTLLVRNPC